MGSFRSLRWGQIPMGPVRRQILRVRDVVDGPSPRTGEVPGGSDLQPLESAEQRLVDPAGCPSPRNPLIEVSQDDGAPRGAPIREPFERLKPTLVVLPACPVFSAGADVSPVPGNANADDGERTAGGLGDALDEAPAREILRTEGIHLGPR